MLLAAVLMTGCALYPAEVISKLPDPAVVQVGSGSHHLGVTRVAHASALLDFDGAVVLTDPWFSEKAGYHHGEPLAMGVDKLPRLAAVIGSHDHYDHFDLETFKAYSDKSVPFVVGVEMVEKAKAAGFTDVRGLAAWKSTRVGDLEITAVPGAHGMPEMTYVLKSPAFTVYFAGDSLLTAAMDEIPTRFGAIDVALLPVNGLHAVGSAVVMSDEEAASLAAKLKPSIAVPIHYTFKGSGFTDTFILSYHGTADGFVKAAAKAAPEVKTMVLEPGQRLDLAKP